MPSDFGHCLLGIAKVCCKGLDHMFQLGRSALQGSEVSLGLLWDSRSHLGRQMALVDPFLESRNPQTFGFVDKL